MKLRRARATASGCAPSIAEQGGAAALLAPFALLLCVYLFLTLGIQGVASSNKWIMGDWLINYSDGFIRRGLIGEIGRQLHYAAGVDPVLFVVVCNALCYATMCATLLFLAARQTISLIEIAILLSPAWLPFEINDPLGAGRKEIVLLALFACYVAADGFFSFTRRPLRQEWRFWFLLLALPFLTFVHEGLFFFLPFFLLYGWMKHDDADGELRVFAIPYVVSAGVMMLSWMFQGGNGIAQVMCSSITSMAVDPNVCGGATAALERYDVRVGAGDVRRYAVLAFLTLAPLLAYAWQTIGTCRRRVLAGIVATALASTPLFVVSEDWGRWIHVTGVLVFITVFACKEINLGLPTRRPALAVAWIAALLFMFSWQMPHWIHSPLPILRPTAEHLMVRAQQAYVVHADTP